MDQEQHVAIGLDQDLKERIGRIFIRDGQLFGAVSQDALTVDEMLQLARAGWARHDYHDAPIMQAPEATIDWFRLRSRHRDQTLHAISHRLPNGAPWIGNRQAILEELLVSTWEQQEETLRTLLHAFAYASMWNHEGENNTTHSIESQETFFFYTERMRTTALKAAEEATEPPNAEDPFWEMVLSLTDI